MKKSLKRALALLLACTIVIGSVYNTRQKAYASASTIIAGGGAATVGIEVAFPYLLAITGVVAAGTAIYQNRDKLKEWGSTQFSKFKKWVNEKKDEFGWWADSALAGVNMAAWGDKLSSGTLDKSDPTWTAYKDWLKDDVYESSGSAGDGLFNGYPTIGFGENLTLTDADGKRATTLALTDSNSVIVMYKYTYNDNYRFLVMPVSATESTYQVGEKIHYISNPFDVNGKTYYYGGPECPYGYNSTPMGICNYMGDTGRGKDLTWSEVLGIAASWLDAGAVPGTETKEKEYTVVGGLAGVGDGAGVIEGDWDVVGVGEAEDEKETKLPWVDDGSIEGVIGGVTTGENTWTDVLDKVGVGVVDKTSEGDMVIDDGGTTTKEWVYAPAKDTVPDITIPDTNTGEVSKELSNYTFAGLEKIFPFCLPFDVIDFIKVLEAPPQAPHFKYAFPYPTLSGMQTYEMDIDLSPFDSVAELLRDMECILFIVGLALVTRSHMIRG